MRGDAMKAVKKLIKEGWIIQHPTGYGLQIAVNHLRIREVRTLIGE